MKIKYVHASAPEEVRNHNTDRALLSLPEDVRCRFTPGEWAQFTLSKFQNDLEGGIVLSYEVVEDEVAKLPFKDLSCHFRANRPQGEPVRKRHWFNVEWRNNESVNDALRRCLKEAKTPYINTVEGVVWFWFDGVWTNCANKVDSDVIWFWVNEYV